MADDFLVIGFTLPELYKNVQEETDAITNFLESGAIDFFHIRKKDTSDSEVASILQMIPLNLMKKIILHTNHNLADTFPVGGIHLKNQTNTTGKNEIQTRGFHSLKEIQDDKILPYYYSFLSPIFDSISKKGYNSRFDINDPNLTHIISKHRIIALGGVKPSDFQKLFDSKFAGAALLGYLWGLEKPIGSKIKEILAARRMLRVKQT